MKSSTNSFWDTFTQRLRISFPFIIALGVFVFIVWTFVRQVGYPFDGISSLHPTGTIKEIALGGPADGKLEVDDEIISIDGERWEEFAGYYGKHGSDFIQFVVDRNGKQVVVQVKLEDQSFSRIMIYLVPLIIAFIFWGIGLGVQAFKPAEGTAEMFFAWSQGCAVTLAAGVASSLGPAWTSSLFAASLWLIGPLSVHFHMNFPQATKFRGSNYLLFAIYSISFAGIFPHLVWGTVKIRDAFWYSSYSSASRLFLAINLLLVVVLLFYNYRHALTPGARAKIRIVALGGGLAAVPFVSLTVIPDALIKETIVPYDIAFLWIALLPLTYGYAIFRLHLIEIERHVNRGATYILVYSFLGVFYLVLNVAVGEFLNTGENFANPFLNTLMILIMASLFFPLHARVQRFVDTIFYGGWYDYRLGLLQIVQGLEQITDLNNLARTVAQRLVHTLRLEETSVFLRGTGGDFSVVEAVTQGGVRKSASRLYPVLPRSSLAYLLRIGVVDRQTLQKKLSQVALTPEELQLLNSEQIHLWVPVVGHGQILGLLALGPKIGGDVFSAEDMDILRSVVLQVGPLIENILLLTRLRQHAAELEQRVEERTAELYDAKERVEAILGSVGDGVIVTDLAGKITTVNSAFEKLTGYTANEVIGKDLKFLWSGENNPTLFTEMINTLTFGEVWSGEFIGQNKDGRSRDMQFTAAPVRDQGGQIVNYVGSQRDITRQKELDRMKDHFIADVSHELRTPTTNISLYLELLEDAPIEKRRKYIQVIKEQSQLLAKLVEDILDLSRLARSKAKRVRFSEIDLNFLSQQVISAHSPLADASGIVLQFEPDSELPLVQGDSNQMSRAIANLVTNAIRYTREGQVCIRTSRYNSQVCLEVCDTGLGIDQEDLPHIFERFYRGRNVRESKIHGTGLGLAIVKEIVDLHEGKINVESGSGRGSKFQIWLPVYKVE